MNELPQEDVPPLAEVLAHVVMSGLLSTPWDAG